MAAAAAPAEQASPAQAGPTDRSMQFMVDMTCEACVKAVRNTLARVPGVGTVDVDLGAQSVVVHGDVSVDAVLRAFEAARRKARLIGQASAGGFDEGLANSLGLDMRTLHQSLAAVSEYKGHDFGHGSCVGVVRFVQVTQGSTRVEGAISGLQPGTHCIAVHTYGDLTKGPSSVGPVFSPEDVPAGAGFVCSFTVDAAGNANFDRAALHPEVQVWDIIGRSLVVHSGDTPAAGSGLFATVIARSAAVGENAEKKICACDGTVIWESSYKL